MNFYNFRLVDDVTNILVCVKVTIESSYAKEK